MFFAALFVALISAQSQPASVSFEELAKNPESYQGKLIEVKGFFIFAFENSGLYPRKPWQGSKGIWVTPNNEMIKKRASLRDHYLKLAGVFDAHDHGHLGQFTGTLAVRSFELVQEPTSQ
jgi:hypothetical protein